MKPMLLILIACAAVSCFFKDAQAQQDSMAVTPVSVEAKVKRGSSYTQTFTLTNNTGTRLRFRCSVLDVWYDDRNNRITGAPGTLPRSASPWVQFIPGDVLVEPRTSTKVKAIIIVPQTAAGGYYTMPVFETLPLGTSMHVSTTSQGNTATASFTVRFRGLMMITTLDASEYNVEILGGRIVPPSSSTQFLVELDLLNRSTAHVRVRGSFAILNYSGDLVGRGTIPEKRYLPGQHNTLRTEWAGELPPGKYTSVITLSYDRVGSEPATLIYELPLVVSNSSSPH